MTNRLAQSQSLYLRKHAENPIDWWPWCDQALEMARTTNRPIFLSVGYSSCHWCTVMEGEAFSDDAIAAYMNSHFVPIKVDREERPDLDSIYMQAVQAMMGQGGWPLNMFLTPGDLVPFYGGTYFPVEPRYGRPGFLQVLKAVQNFYQTEATKLASQKQALYEHLQQTTLLEPAAVTSETLQHGISEITAIVQRSRQGPSFPMIPYAHLVLQGQRGTTSVSVPENCQQRGLDLALGGIYDHVAGGWHRYTVDSDWTVPHFEKMLYDNGQIMEYLANLWRAGLREPAFERAVNLTADWLAREMTGAGGYFYAAQDADNFVEPTDLEPEEGRFYVWDDAALAQVLSSAERQALAQAFDLKPTGNFEGRTVLKRQSPGLLSDVVEGSLAKLFAVRYGALPTAVTAVPPALDNSMAKTHHWPGRIPPVTDTKMIVAWNSLMISGLAQAAVAFGQDRYLQMANTAADFIVAHQWVGGHLQRLNYGQGATEPAQSEDYAFWIKAVLDLQQACACLEETQRAEGWLQVAIQAQAEFDDYLWALEGGGYYNTVATDQLLMRERSWLDNATPAANGVAIANLTRLALLTEDLSHLERAEQALQTFGQVIQNTPTACPSLLAGADWYANHTLVRTTPAQCRSLAPAHYFPTVVFAIATDLPQDTVGLVCAGLTCDAPATSQQELLQQIKAHQNRSQT